MVYSPRHTSAPKERSPDDLPDMISDSPDIIPEVYICLETMPSHLNQTTIQLTVQPSPQPFLLTDHIQSYTMRPIFLTFPAFARTAFGVTRTTTVNVISLPTEISTVTIKNVDPTATTYEYACLQTSGNHTTMLVPTSGWGMGSFSDLSSTSAPTSAPGSPPNCTAYTFTQGPSTWAMAFDQPGATFSGNCTVHPDKILSTPVRDCVSTFAYSSGATNLFGQGSNPGSEPTSGMANVTAVGEASFIGKF